MKKSLLLCMLLITGCMIEKEEFVDLRQYWDASSRSFIPTDVRLGGMNYVAFAMDIQATKASGVTAATVIQSILKLKEQDRVVEISGIYNSTDQKGEKITLSGKIILPETEQIKRVILVSHYTIGRNQEAPSRCFPLEGVLSKLGYALIIPDYIGYGVTGNMIHPYLMMELTIPARLHLEKNQSWISAILTTGQ